MDKIDELIGAVLDDDIAAVRRLLKQKPQLVLEADEMGYTPLMFAVSNEQRSLACVQVLLDAGADVHAAARGNLTVLHSAVGDTGSKYLHESPALFIKMLADAGAPLEEQRQPWGWTPLVEAIATGTLHEARALLEAGANPNALSPVDSSHVFIRGRSALSAAIGDAEKVELLLAHGADVHARDLHGQTALEYALQVLEQAEDYKDFKRKVMQSVRVLKKAMAAST